jgi:Type II secretion system (T2SS), protein M subtype b
MNGFYLRLPVILRRVFFVAANVGALVLFYNILVQPLTNLRDDQNERIATLRGQLLRAEQLASRDAEVKELIARAKAEETSGELWSGDTPSAISAAMQSAIRDFAAQSDLRLRSVRGLSDQGGSSPARQVLVRVEASGELTAVHAFLTKIEQATPFLFGTSLSLRNAVQTSPSGRQSEPLLELQLDVSGQIRGGP